MASGKAHARASLLLAFSGIPIAIWTRDPLAGLAVAAGCVSGIPINPDNDQEGVNRFEWQLVKGTFGVGFLWLAFWWPYAVALRHRALLSHFPGLSTAGRILYSFCIPAAVALILGWRPGMLFTWFFGWWCVGLLESDTAHWFMDRCPV